MACHVSFSPSATMTGNVPDRCFSVSLGSKGRTAGSQLLQSDNECEQEINLGKPP